MKLTVCKTVVAYPGKPRFVVMSEAEPYMRHEFDSLVELAEAFQRAAEPSLPPQEPRIIKNDTPIGDIFWVPTNKPAFAVTLYERLSRNELHQLASLLRK